MTYFLYMLCIQPQPPGVAEQKSFKAARMLFVLNCSLLLICIFLKYCSSSDPDLKVLWLKKAPGEDILIECSTNKNEQDGVSMFMSKKGANTHQEIFYLYKTNSIKYKSQVKCNVTGRIPKLNVTFNNATEAHTGIYWCEFNKEEIKTLSKITFVSIDNKTNQEPEDAQECPEFPLNVMILFCMSVFLLCIIGSICVAQKMKGLWGKKKYKPSNASPDSVYEDMRRNTKPTERSFINPQYQSNTELR